MNELVSLQWLAKLEIWAIGCLSLKASRCGIHARLNTDAYAEIYRLSFNAIGENAYPIGCNSAVNPIENVRTFCL